jgi:hypothetical protein
VEYKFAKLLYDCTVYCPPNLAAIWNQYDGTTNVLVVALWDWDVGDVVLPLSGTGPAGIGGAYGRVEEGSWKSCFVCHIAAVNPWSVVAGYNGTPVTKMNPDTRWVQHPDQCQPCHGQPAYALIDNMPSAIWTHNVVGGEAVWDNCDSCHAAISQEVSRSVHAGLGCRCHSIVHFGYEHGGNWLASLYTYEGAGSSVETATSVVKLERVYTQGNATLGVSNLFYNVTGVAGPGRNVEAGLWDAYVNDFITTLSFPASDSRFGNPGLGPSRVWTACFNCHFLSIDPSTVSNPHRIGWSFTVEEAWDVGGGAASVEFDRW